MEFLTGLLIGLTFWEVVLFAAFFGVSIIAAETDLPWVFVIGLVAMLTALNFLGGWPVFEAIPRNPVLIIVAAGFYALLGGLWALFLRWPEWLDSQSDRIRSAKRAFDKGLDKNGGKPFTASSEYLPFTAAENSGLIGSYIMTWFFDAFWRALHRPVYWLWFGAYKIFANGFATVGARKTASILKDGK